MANLLKLLLVVLAVAACESAPPPAPPAPPKPWAIERVEAQGALVSVWGSSANDVWAVGGSAGHGLVLHNDGHNWAPVYTGATSMLWWVYGIGATDVYAAGERGLVMRHAAAGWQTVPTGTTKNLYGVWGRDAGDVWAVGGDPHGKPGDAVILRGDSKGLHPVALPTEMVANVMYKVYGTPAGDVVAVGAAGTILRFNGAWHREQVPTTAPVISLWGGGGERLYAVGGDATGELLYFDGATWTKVGGVQAGLEFFGVFKAPGQPVLAVGAGPRILEMAPDGAPVELDTPALSGATVLHSVWGDGKGVQFAVGGTLYGDPDQLTGVVLRR